jgi:hypothetical protein
LSDCQEEYYMKSDLATGHSGVGLPLNTSEWQVSARNRCWFWVRIHAPCRTQNNLIDGVVITFFDINSSKALEFTLIETLSALEKRFSSQTAEFNSAEKI